MASKKTSRTSAPKAAPVQPADPVPAKAARPRRAAVAPAPAKVSAVAKAPARRKVAAPAPTPEVVAPPASRPVTDDEIRLRAYFLSLEHRGRGGDIDFWLIAERELRSRATSQD